MKQKAPALAGLAILAGVLAGPAAAQTPAPRPPQAQAAQPPAAPPQEPPGARQGTNEAADGVLRWEALPAMTLERVYRGPLRDTVIQRWRDPTDNSVCFVYLPMRAAIAGQAEQLVYGPNTIGSISCAPAGQVLQLQLGSLQGGAAAPGTPPPAANAPAQRPR